MSRDRGTQKQKCDFGYGQVCTLDGQVLENIAFTSANQEHGILSCGAGASIDIANQLPIGTRLRVLPNHACATGAQHGCYQAFEGDGRVVEWPRFYGW